MILGIKFICYAALTFIPVGISYGQNWELLNADKTYFYRYSDSVHITNTIQIDSLTWIGTDTIYHLHSRLKLCDTCTIIPSSSIDGNLYHAYWPELFGHSPYLNVTANQYHFSDGIINHKAEVMSSWTFNTTSGIAATVVDKYETIQFGMNDSVKVIELATGDTIIISKYFGVLRYPDFENSGKYYQLVGYHHGQNSVGEFLPNMYSLYNYNPGDVFCYQNTRISFGSYFEVEYQLEMTILENINYSDTISYRVKMTGWDIYNDLDESWLPINQSSSTIHYIDTLVILNKANLFENNYEILHHPPDSIVYFPLNPDYLFYTENLPDGVNYTSFFFSPYDLTCDVPLYVISHPFSATYGYIKTINPYSMYGDSLCFPVWGDCNPIIDESVAGIGKLRHVTCCFEGMGEDHLVGYKKDSISYGIVYNFPDDLRINNANQIDFSIYPNPTADILYIYFNDATFSGSETIQVFDIQGNLMREWPVTMNDITFMIDVSMLHAGAYIIKHAEGGVEKSSIQFIKN